MKNRKIITIIGFYYRLLIMLVLMCIPLIGCTYSVTNGQSNHSIFTIRKGLSGFSFEFSDYYKIGRVDVYDDFTSVSLDGPLVTEIQAFKFISISVSKFDSENPDITSAVDNHLKYQTYSLTLTSIERDSIEILGHAGEELVYHFEAPRPLELQAEGYKPLPRIVMYSAFSYKNLLWEIQITGFETSFLADQSDFENILQTFKLLD